MGVTGETDYEMWCAVTCGNRRLTYYPFSCVIRTVIFYISVCICYGVRDNFPLICLMLVLDIYVSAIWSVNTEAYKILEYMILPVMRI